MHSSQPVQSAAITVWLKVAAPMIASTGQTSTQRVQPMQAGSSMKATPGAGSAGMMSLAFLGFSGLIRV